MLFWPIMIIGIVISAVFVASAPEMVGLAPGERTVQAIYLGLLLAGILFGGIGRMVLRSGRRALLNAAAWVGIFGIAVGGYAFRGEAGYIFDRIRGELIPSMALSHTPGEVELRRAWDGHYRADARINGHEIRMMVDTGASMVLIPYEQAALLGIDPDLLSYSMPVSTANGQSSVAPVRLASIQVGPIVVRDVAAAVAHPGRLSSPLLGMSFIERLSETTFRGDRLILRQYAGDTPGSVILNGRL
jgi:aspartyl protease family protein